MSGFSEPWLSLREPADRAARDPRLAADLRNWHDARGARSWRIVDLGAGTGANLRHLAPRLGMIQHWRLLDHDASLLASLPARTRHWADAQGHSMHTASDAIQIAANGFSARVTTAHRDLARDLDGTVVAAFEDMPAADSELLTASALLDLAGQQWLDELVAGCIARSCAALFTLTYDGGIEWMPAHGLDDRVHAAFNEHQRSDKGLGPALGPLAGHAMAAALRTAGFDVDVAPSHWRLDTHHASLQATLIADWSRSLSAWRPEEATMFDRWARERMDLLSQSRLTITHVDVLALPHVLPRPLCPPN